ncbi:uncharacterized protein LOC132106157 [Carassius carassius]|uniref:uncharacterized protein LOC132106157 n=1 Tax=Carassius carassius TaxID=217509 RepID=UPI002868DD38|nr:uncharacterized protein LOC132106157 [Carassius carassius]
MGAKVSVVNQTPYTWYFDTQDNRGYTYIGPGSTTSYEEALAIHRYIYFRYENHSWSSFSYEFNTHKGNTCFILKETYDRSQIQMHCTSEGGTHYCPNYGKIKEDENRRQQQEEEERRRQNRQIEEENKRRQQEEEKRRLERLEREQRIQQELDRESELSRRKLSRATERLREKQSFRGHEKHHERTQVLQQQIEDDAAAIEWNEV